MSRAKCDTPDCGNFATVHLMHSLKRVCGFCAQEIQNEVREVITRARFPRAAITLEAIAVAEVLRNAATELDELAGSAPAYEVGTLRGKVRAIVLGALAFADDTTEGDECVPQT